MPIRSGIGLSSSGECAKLQVLPLQQRPAVINLSELEVRSVVKLIRLPQIIPELDVVLLVAEILRNLVGILCHASQVLRNKINRSPVVMVQGFDHQHYLHLQTALESHIIHLALYFFQSKVRRFFDSLPNQANFTLIHNPQNQGRGTEATEFMFSAGIPDRDRVKRVN